MSSKGGIIVPKTIVRENETIEDALKRFKRDVVRSGTLQEARKREGYLKPSDIRKMKKRAQKKSRYSHSN